MQAQFAVDAARVQCFPCWSQIMQLLRAGNQPYGKCLHALCRPGEHDVGTKLSETGALLYRKPRDIQILPVANLAYSAIVGKRREYTALLKALPGIGIERIPRAERIGKGLHGDTEFLPEPALAAGDLG